MPPTEGSTATSSAGSGEQGYQQLPWTAIPKFIPGTTDVTEYTKKLEFLAAMWPKEHLSQLAPRAALLCEGSAFKKVAGLAPDKLKANDVSGVKLLVDTLGGSWGRTAVEQKYDTFERAIFGTIQKADETNDSYLARHDIHFEELLAQGVSFEEVRAYILLRQSSLTAEDRKRIVVELDGQLSYKKVCASVRLLGSRFFSDFQGQRGNTKTKTYDAHMVEDAGSEEVERAYQASTTFSSEEPDFELDAEFIEAMIAVEDQDALQVQSFEEELEGFFQETPELQEALVSYLEARSRLLAKRKARGFWPAHGSKGSKGGKGFKGKGKGKSAKEQLLQRIAKSHCRACGERGHWKAECPKFGKPGSKSEAGASVAQATVTQAQGPHEDEVFEQLPEEAITLAEAFCAVPPNPDSTTHNNVACRLSQMVQNLKNRKPKAPNPSRPCIAGAAHSISPTFFRAEAETCEPGSVPATAYVATSRVEAILDTGASRCVMGRILLPQLLSQLSSRVRSQIRVVRSSVKFRFGNNQTLTSDKKIMLPIRTIGCQILWLGIEVVPGSTPLLFSKKAIKQLGGIINTNTDCCFFKRLRQQVSLKTSATGLYLLDLADLCDQSRSEECPEPSCEDHSESQTTEDPCMNAISPSTESPKPCTVSPVAKWMRFSTNSEAPRFRKYPEHVNDNPSTKTAVEDGVLEQPPIKPLMSNQVTNVSAVTASASAQAVPIALSSPPDHGRIPRNRGIHQPRHEVCPPQRCLAASHDGRGGSNDPARAWSADHHFRNKSPRHAFPRPVGKQSPICEVVLRTPRRQCQALPSGVSSLRGASHPTGRGDCIDREGADAACQRGRSQGRWKDSHEVGVQKQGGPTFQSDSQRRGRSLGHDPRANRRFADRGQCAESAHDQHGKYVAAAGAPHQHPADPSECLLGELEACRDELCALISDKVSSKSRLQGIEEEARKVLQASQDVTEYKKFLRKVPWYLLKESSQGSRAIAEGQVDEDRTHPPAYVMFGMYSHGGVTGITSITRQLPSLAQILAAVIKGTQPEHTFATVAVSCNTSVTPHRDSYNSRDVANLVVPLDFPRTGGEIWVAKPPEAQQKAQSMLCNGQWISDSLVSLKGSMLLDPHMWHASAPWTGNRTLLVGFALQTAYKLSTSEAENLQGLGFVLPPSVSAKEEILNIKEELSALRKELLSAQPLVQDSQWPPAAVAAAHACADAFCRAQVVSWDVFQDSMLTYQSPLEAQIDLLEVSTRSDSRLTDVINESGGKARRFTNRDGDLNTVEGQRALWDTLQRTQPKHVWLSPDARHWSPWTRLNAARDSRYQKNLLDERQREQTVLQLLVKIFEWQKQNGRHCHLEQPASSQMLDSPILKTLMKEAYQSNVDLCAFGFRTPMSHRPIRKTTSIVSTSEAFVRTLREKQCPGHPSHQPLSGKLRELGGKSVCQYAGTFCRGFAEHCARHLLHATEQALALGESLPMTRKRFKTSLGIGSPATSLPSQKRAADDPQERAQRDQQRRRLDDPLSQSLHDTQVLSVSTWEPVFTLIQGCASKATPVLVPPQHDVIASLSQALPQYQVLQVFASSGSKSLHHPLGALPATVAPWRISIGARSTADATTEYVCLGKDNRTTMPSERRRMRIAAVRSLITVFAQTKPTVSTPELPERTDVQSRDVTTPDLEGWAPPPVPLHGPAFRSLTSEEKCRLRRIHNNLGHPSPETLARHLKAANESPSLIEAALDFQCDVCLESTEPRHQRPSKLPEPRDFNDLIGIDGFFFKSQSGYRAYAIHALDEASCFRAPSRLGDHAKQALNDFWISWAGPPKQVYLDPAGEFRSEQILGYFQELNIKAWVTVAAWQRGRLERHGDILKDMIARMDLESPIVNDTTFDQALLQAILAKNALVRHGGYSPEQIVFGKALRVPGSLTSDEDSPAHALSEGVDLESELHR